MLKKLIRWLMGFHHRRKAQALIEQYELTQKSDDRTHWLGTYFVTQEEFLLSSALDGVYINKLPVASCYIYDSIGEVKNQLNSFLTQLEKNGAINTMALNEFQTNARSVNIHEVFDSTVPVKEQLLEINGILNKIVQAHKMQTGSIRTMNLSRLVPLFEMFAIIVNRVTVGYLATS